MFAATDEFYKAAGGRLTPASRQECEQAFSYFLDVDLQLDERTLRAHVVRRLDEPPPGRAELARETKRKYLIRVRQFTRWLVEARHLEFNPMDGVEIPPQRRYRKQLSDLFTLEEVAAFVNYHRTAARDAATVRRRRQHIEHAVTIELVSLLGMRPSEIIRARWEDVEQESWRIWGKATPTSPGDNDRTSKTYRSPRACRDAHASIRYIPIRQREEDPLLDQWYRRVETLLGDLEEFAAGNDGWLVRISTVQAANRGLKLAMKECNVPARGRSFRRLRHTARWYMEEYLRLDPTTIGDILGHSAVVSFNDYRTAPDAATLARRIGDRAAAA